MFVVFISYSAVVGQSQGSLYSFHILELFSLGCSESVYWLYSLYIVELLFSLGGSFYSFYILKLLLFRVWVLVVFVSYSGIVAQSLGVRCIRFIFWNCCSILGVRCVRFMSGNLSYSLWVFVVFVLYSGIVVQSWVFAVFVSCQEICRFSLSVRCIRFIFWNCSVLGVR